MDTEPTVPETAEATETAEVGQDVEVAVDHGGRAPSTEALARLEAELAALEAELAELEAADGSEA